MSAKGKLILIVVGGLVIIAVIIWVFLGTGKAPKTPAVDETQPVAKVEVKPATVPIQVPALSETEKAETSLKALATSFAERFGTYTNQSGYAGLEDLTPLLTPSMSNWLKNTYIPKLKSEHDPKGFFYRVITSAPVVEVLTQTADRATVMVSSQRTETVNQDSSASYLQDLKIEFLKKTNQWLVDGAFWQIKR